MKQPENLLKVTKLPGILQLSHAIEEAKNTMGVEFVNDVDKEAFREATSGMINDYCTQYPGVKKLLDIIDSVE